MGDVCGETTMGRQHLDFFVISSEIFCVNGGDSLLFSCLECKQIITDNGFDEEECWKSAYQLKA